MQEANEIEVTNDKGEIQTVLTFNQEMKQRLEDAKKRRVQEKNLMQEDGTEKYGLTYTTEQEYDTNKVKEKVGGEELLIEGDVIQYGKNLFVKIDRTKANASTTLSFELNQIDNRKAQEARARGFDDTQLSEKFKSVMEAIDPYDVYDFLSSNAYIGYNENYYNSFENKGLVDKLEESRDGDNDFEIETIIRKIAILSKQEKAILQANRDLKRPSEMNFDGMDKEEVREILTIRTKLEDLYKDASKIVGKGDFLDTEKETISETVVNKAFIAYMADRKIGKLTFDGATKLDNDDLDNIDQIFRAVGNHSTTSTNTKVTELRSIIAKVADGTKSEFRKTEARVFSKTIEEYSEMDRDEVVASMTNDLLKYSYAKLLPYFKKSRPIGADIALEELESGVLSAKEFIERYDNKEYEFLQITPNYTFQEVTDDSNRDIHYESNRNNGNPMFRTFEPGTTKEDVLNKSIDQLVAENKLNKYVNVEFLKQYDIDMSELFKSGKEVARTNLDKFNARQAFLNLQKSTIEKAAKTGQHNLYKLPQKEKGKFRKIEDILKSGKNVKTLLDELVNFREDDADLGKDGEGVSTKVAGVHKIPRYGFRTLTESETTDEIIESYIWMNKEANLHKARVNNIGDMMTLKEALLKDEFGQDLGLLASNTYKMFEDAMNYNYFGIKEVFSKQFRVPGTNITMDLGKILRNFGQLIRIRNLGFTIISPITSAITGYVQANLIEKYVGEVIDKDALKAGTKYFRKTAGDAMREVTGLQGKSTLNAVGYRWGIFEIDDRYNNSTFGKGVRALGQSVFAAHQIGNFPINTPVGLSVLADHKFVDGQIIRYREFKDNNRGTPDKELRKEWEDYVSILDATVVDDNGVVGYDYPKIIQSLNSNATEEEVKQLIEKNNTKIRSVVKMAIQRVDAQIAPEDKAMASRNAIMSFLTTHRNWLFLSTSYKLKGRQLSTATGEYEEGSWKNTASFISNVFKDAKNGNSAKLLGQIKKTWNDADETTRINVRRTAIEMAVLNSLIVLMYAVFNLGDDEEEDSYALKVTQLFSMRLTNEISSSTVGLPKNLYDTLEGLVVGLNTLNIITDAPNMFSSDIVERGRYQGLTEREKYFYQNMVISREYWNLSADLSGNIKS
jgi:hypothetical protein